MQPWFLQGAAVMIRSKIKDSRSSNCRISKMVLRRREKMEQIQPVLKYRPEKMKQ